MVAPAISTVVQQLKGIVSKKTGISLWQKSFHDHAVRSKQDYLEIWNYIEINPEKWIDDCFYTKQHSKSPDSNESGDHFMLLSSWCNSRYRRNIRW